MMPEQRLRDTWILLGLVDSELLLERMLLPKSLQGTVQEHLGVLCDESSLVVEVQETSYRLLGLVDRERGSGEAAYLVDWSRDILVVGGMDRLAEMAWQSIAFGYSECIPASGQVHEFLTRLGEDLRSMWEPRPLTLGGGLDLSLVDRWSLDLSSLETQISLICSYNDFLRCWARTVEDAEGLDIRALYETGASVAKVLAMEGPLPYPDLWRWRMQRFKAAGGRS